MSNGISMHVGINRVDPQHYGGVWSGLLNACEADAEAMQDIAKAKGYDSQILLTDKATRSAVIAGIENAAAKLAPADLFFLSYSGHGGQVPDLGGDEDDLQDDTWCLYDGELIDDELAELWAHFAKGVRILVLSDSCHSGTATKMREYDELAATGVVQRAASGVEADKPPVFRVMPDEVAQRTYRANKEFYMEIALRLPKSPSPITATVRLISGCMENQLSLDGAFNGLFTGTLLRIWNDGAFAGNYGKFHSEILKRMPSTQSPNHFIIGEPNSAFDAQNPFEI